MTILNANEYITKGEAVQVLHNAYAEGRIQAKDGCASVLDDIAAIKADVQPVRHGKWDGYICSECNVCADYFISGDFYFDEKPNFCPNCGARMDKS